MATWVGKQSGFTDALKELVELDYDLLEGYEAAINRIQDESYRNKIKEFKETYRRHIKEITDLLSRCAQEVPKGPSKLKKWVTQGKVILSNMMGDKKILAALLDNETDAHAAYQRILERKDKLPDCETIIKNALNDTKAHKDWLKNSL